MTFFEFLETNYIWLLVVAVVLIITIIGYLADRRDKKKKKAQVQAHNESNVVPQVDAVNTGVINQTQPINQAVNNIDNNLNADMGNRTMQVNPQLLNQNAVDVSNTPNVSEVVAPQIDTVNTGVVNQTQSVNNMDNNLSTNVGSRPMQVNSQLLNQNAVNVSNTPNVSEVVAPVAPEINTQNTGNIISNIANSSPINTVNNVAREVPSVESSMPINNESADSNVNNTLNSDAMFRIVPEADTNYSTPASIENAYVNQVNQNEEVAIKKEDAPTNNMTFNMPREEVVSTVSAINNAVSESVNTNVVDVPKNDAPVNIPNIVEDNKQVIPSVMPNIPSVKVPVSPISGVSNVESTVQSTNNIVGDSQISIPSQEINVNNNNANANVNTNNFANVVNTNTDSVSNIPNIIIPNENNNVRDADVIADNTNSVVNNSANVNTADKIDDDLWKL
mgnify:CR=1 FL=1